MHNRRRELRITRRHLLSAAACAGAVSHFPPSYGLLNTEGTPTAPTAYGKVRGVVTNGVFCFRGIPYGGDAGGANRFMPPTTPAPWKGVRDASRAGPRAVQEGNDSIFASPLIGDYFSGGRSDAIELTRERNSENCLVLNVLTPALSGKRPVMVYIHGGGFDALSGALTLISDRFVVEQNVVLVGVNHRLNVLGYTYLGGLDSRYPDSGNVGQLDLIAALRWVQGNITNFGGDPTNVTLFGESGGGGKISTLLAMPAARGLFHRAIIESGSFFLKGRTAESATEDARGLLSKLDLTSSSVGRLWELPAEKLLAAYLSRAGHGGPVVDGRSIPHQTWTPYAPVEAAGVSLIVGSCQDETTLFSLDAAPLYTLDWSTLREQEIKSGVPEDKVDTIISAYRTSNPSESPSDLYFRIAADRGFRGPAISQADLKVDQRDGDVYMYYFAWDTQLDNGRLRAFHTAELPLAMRLVSNPKAEDLSRQIAGAWAAFARTGDPNHAGLPRWEKYSREQRATMVFDAGNSALAMNPAKDELALLASVPKGFPYEE